MIRMMSASQFEWPAPAHPDRRFAVQRFRIHKGPFHPGPDVRNRRLRVQVKRRDEVLRHREQRHRHPAVHDHHREHMDALLRVEQVDRKNVVGHQRAQPEPFRPLQPPGVREKHPEGAPQKQREQRHRLPPQPDPFTAQGGVDQPAREGHRAGHLGRRDRNGHAHRPDHARGTRQQQQRSGQIEPQHRPPEHQREHDQADLGQQGVRPSHEHGKPRHDGQDGAARDDGRVPGHARRLVGDDGHGAWSPLATDSCPHRFAAR